MEAVDLAVDGAAIRVEHVVGGVESYRLVVEKQRGRVVAARTRCSARVHFPLEHDRSVSGTLLRIRLKNATLQADPESRQHFKGELCEP